ncbi:hypothetical protein [Sphingobacterium composti Ten et al. 2007 non Yoo et al. 2007]|uniref:hypothetical protein n=1 Tax=Sphingobacterium composti TaxID=363260 RepID=UPI001F21502A|nr:hypothetical protein [Sphingobacterium composti Ten et al. 2007 non Yoo et al. 2007]
MDIRHILDTVFHFDHLFGDSKNANIVMKKIFTEMKDVARIALIFLTVLALVKLFGWMFKTIFN